MTDIQVNGHSEVPPLTLVPPPDVKVPRDTSFEHALDETAPKPEPVHDGDGIEIPKLGGERRRRHPRAPADVEGHPRTAASTWTPPGSTPRSTGCARRCTWSSAWCGPSSGVIRLAEAQRRWWWVSEQSSLRSKAVVDGNSPEWRSLHNDVRRDALVARVGARRRGGSSWLRAWCSGPRRPVVGVAHRRRRGHAAARALRAAGQRPIVQSAVTTPLVRKISTDAIVRAYERAGLCSTDPKKPADAPRVRVR